MASHKRMVLSALADARSVPFGLKATALMTFLWPVRVDVGAPEATFQSLDGFLVVAGGDEFAIGTEGGVDDGAARSSEVADFCAGFDIPDANGFIVHGGGEPAAIGTECDGVDPTDADRGDSFVGREFVDRLTGYGVENCDGVCSVFCGEEFSVVREGDGLDLFEFAW